MAGQSINKVFLLGNLCWDPELRTTGSGKQVATFNIATSERGRGEGGEPRTEWHRIVTWDRLAEQCSQFLSKGRQVHVEGRLQTRSWEDRNGNKRQTTEIVAFSVLFLSSASGRGGQGAGHDGPPPIDDGDYGSGGPRGPRSGGESNGSGGGGPSRDESRDSPAPSGPERKIPYEDEDEDIPF